MGDVPKSTPSRRHGEASVHHGATLATIRELLGLSQPELALASDVSEGMIANIEAGNRQPSKATVLAIHGVLAKAAEGRLRRPLRVEAWATVTADELAPVKVPA